ncbi:MAG TPA: site-2 protease family protein [Caldilineaceae bacterium]|nr:site-2 protease family protein [Caldilineaceae bacterium]
MNRGITLGRIAGIPIGLDYSWFLIFGLLTWTLAADQFPTQYPGWPSAQYWVIGAVAAIMLFVSVLLHELGHSVVAIRYQIPVRSITLFIFGGVAQIGAEPPSAGADFWVAIAGPVVSFALAILFWLLSSALHSVAPLLALATYLAYINGALAAFNLIPGFPLDGGRVLRAALWGATHSLRSATLIAANVGRVIAYLFIVGGVWLVFTGNVGNGLWIAFIGWFLESAASAQVSEQRLHDWLAGHKVAEVMNHTVATVRPDITLQALVDQHILVDGQRAFVVAHDDAIDGLLTLHHVKDIPHKAWPTTTVAQAMLPTSQVITVAPDEEIWTALEEMDRDGVNQLPVMVAGRVVGMLTREDLITFLRRLRAANS